MFGNFFNKFIPCGRIKRLGRSDRPENEDNAQIFLSDVYTKSTQAKKYQAEASLYGRSMVEMLGVLAIIGVLSVGGLEGYNRAMLKYKLNKQSDQFNTLFSAISRYKNDLKPQIEEGEDSHDLIPFLKKLNEIPNEMIRNNSTIYIYDVFNDSIRIYRHNTGYIGINLAINTSSYSHTICQNIYMAAKPFSAQISALEIGNFNVDSTSYAGLVFGDERCTGTRKCLKNLTLDDADELCKQCSNESNYCALYVIWW